MEGKNTGQPPDGQDTKPKPIELGVQDPEASGILDDSTLILTEHHNPSEELAVAIGGLAVLNDVDDRTVPASIRAADSNENCLSDTKTYFRQRLWHDDSDSSASASLASNSDGCHSSLPLTPSSSATFEDELVIPAITRKDDTSIQYSNEYFRVASSQIAGWGAFATRDLQDGQIILRELPLFEAKREDVLQKFRGLSKKDQKVGLSLYGYESKPGRSAIESIWDTNCFVTASPTRAGLFPIAARLNHACSPANNIAFHFDGKLGCLVLRVCADEIKEGDELTICYVVDCLALDLYQWYGFRCKCGTCEGVNDEDVEMLRNQW